MSITDKALPADVWSDIAELLPLMPNEPFWRPWLQ